MCDGAEPGRGPEAADGPRPGVADGPGPVKGHRQRGVPDGLVTPRLLLRSWRHGDHAPAAELNADAVAMAHMPAPLDREASDALVARLRAHDAAFGYTLWVIEIRRSARGATSFAGFAGLQHVPFEPPFPCSRPCLEVGWRLLPAWWGLGIATEAGRASLSFGFEQLGATEIVAFTVPRNERSRAVMARLGMVADGEFDHPRASGSDWWRRHVLYRATPDLLAAPEQALDPSVRP